MKITIVSRIYWPEPSAASSFLTATADALSARGHRVRVLTTTVPRTPMPNTRRERISRWPVLRDASGYVRGYAQYLSFDIPLAIRLACMARVDVVLVEPPPTTGAVVRLVCGIRRIPYVYDVADIWSDAVVNATSSSAVARVLRAVERFALAGARALVTISAPVGDRIAQLSVRTPTIVTGFGADTESFDYDPAANRRRTFVYGGTFSEIHGAAVLVRGFAEFHRDHPGYTLRFIGNGTERQPLERLASELGVADAVDFRPAMPAAELAAELNQAEAALASLNPDANYAYAFTTKAYSALASGCPVIFTGPGPTRTLFESAPATVRAGVAVDYDSHAVAEALALFAREPLSPAERKRLAAWTRAEHSLDAVARRVVDVLESATRTQRGDDAEPNR